MTYDELDEARRGGGTRGTLLLHGAEPVAGMVTEDYLDGRVVLLGYLVVAATARNAGLGARLLAEVVEAPAGGAPPLVLAEIDDPRFHPSNDMGDPVARVRFYDRAGARLLPLPYAQPSLRPGSPRVDNLLLIALGTTEPWVDGPTVAAFLTEYYEGCEGEDAVRADPAFLALRDAVLGRDGHLPLHPLSDLGAARPGPD
jgi:GNAT superfamily N-acetyltransferase